MAVTANRLRIGKVADVKAILRNLHVFLHPNFPAGNSPNYAPCRWGSLQLFTNIEETSLGRGGNVGLHFRVPYWAVRPTYEER
jgi:hypothetical protein